jgi:hypothetical protein
VNKGIRDLRFFMKKNLFNKLTHKFNTWSKVLREILYGMTIHEIDLEIKREKAHLENLFMLIVFGDLIGLPILPPYYSMRLLPYIIKSVEKWKRGLLREKDVTDLFSEDIG